MPRSTRREEIAALLALREREGLTYAELSERCGLAATTLSWWSCRLRRESRSKTAFREVVAHDEPEQQSDPARVIVRRGSLEIEVEGATIDRIREIVMILSERPC